MHNFINSTFYSLMILLSFFSIFVFPLLIIILGVIRARIKKKKGLPLAKTIINITGLEIINAVFVLFGLMYHDTEDDPLLTIIMLLFVAIPMIIVYVLPLAYIVVGAIWLIKSRKNGKRIVKPIVVTIILEAVNVIPTIFVVQNIFNK